MTAAHLDKQGFSTRFRSSYEKLPPGVQLVGLQVWLPTLFVFLFCFCYIFAFHAPAPKDVPVAVVGSSSSTSAFASTLESESKGALVVTTEPSLAAAQADVRDGDLAAAYVPQGDTATLVIASAAQYQLATLAKSYFTPVAAAAGATLTIDDLAPLPAGDSFGTSLFYLTLVFIIGGYMIAMFVGLMGGALRHRTRVGIIALFAVVFPLIDALIVRFVLHVTSGHFLAIWATGAATAFAIGLIVNGLSYFMGRFVTGGALFLFVFLNVPSSGGAFPPELVPEPFRSLHPFVSGTGTIDLLRDAVYGVGPGVGAGLRILAVYAAVGLALTLLGRPYARRKAARRAERGARPTMMQSAQAAAAAAAAHPAPKETATPQELDEAVLEATELRVDEADTDAVAAVTGSTA